MRTLKKQSIPNMLLRYIFELKIMTVNGYTPQVFECVSCGTSDDVYLFSVDAGGLICSDCRGQLHSLIPLSGSTIYTMQFILVTPIEKLYTFTVTDEVLKELKKVMTFYIRLLTERTFKSLEVLDSLYT